MTLTLDGGGWSTLRPGHFTLGQDIPSALEGILNMYMLIEFGKVRFHPVAGHTGPEGE